MIKSLTSLRFFAALAVVIEHFGNHLNIGGPGVIFFFVLSGFIIAFTYADRIESITVQSLKEMYALRIGRIFPLHLFMFVVCIPIAVLSSDAPKAYVFFTNAFLLHSWYPSHDDYFSFNSVSWTLSIEWFFYLCFPFVVIPLRNAGAFATKGRCLIFSCAALALILVINAIYNHGGEFLNRTWWAMKISPINVLVFFVGSGIGMWRLKISARDNISMVADSILEMLAIVAPVAAYFIFASWGVTTTLGIGYIASYVPAFAFMIMVFSCTNGLISKALSHPALVRLGNLSFSIYMTHQAILNYTNDYVGSVVGANSSFLVKLLMFSIILAASELTYRLIENPARIAAKKYVMRNRAEEKEGQHLARQ